MFTTQANFSIKHFETANILVDNVTIKNDLVAGNSQINAQDYSIEEQHARVRLEALLLKKRELQVELENITQSNMEKMEIKPEEGKNYTNYVKGALIVAILAIIVLGIWTVFRRTPPDGNEPGDNAMSRELSSVPVYADSDNTSLTSAYARSGPAETRFQEVHSPAAVNSLELSPVKEDSKPAAVKSLELSPFKEDSKPLSGRGISEETLWCKCFEH